MSRYSDYTSSCSIGAKLLEWSGVVQSVVSHFDQLATRIACQWLQLFLFVSGSVQYYDICQWQHASRASVYNSSSSASQSSEPAATACPPSSTVQVVLTRQRGVNPEPSVPINSAITHRHDKRLWQSTRLGERKISPEAFTKIRLRS